MGDMRPKPWEFVKFPWPMIIPAGSWITVRSETPNGGHLLVVGVLEEVPHTRDMSMGKLHFKIDMLKPCGVYHKSKTGDTVVLASVGKSPFTGEASLSILGGSSLTGWFAVGDDKGTHWYVSADDRAALDKASSSNAASSNGADMPEEPG